jgi:tRNA (adenine22-N1)-methyltransferase
MKFPDRIVEIAKFIPNGCKMIDIGCDHCLLGIYMAKNRDTKNIIASDINPEPLLQAERNLANFGLEDTVKIRLGNGLEVIENNEIDTIVISGLGGNKIVDILNEIEVFDSIKNIVLQPNNNIYEVRYWLTRHGFFISDEKIIEENNNIYEILLFKKGKRKYNIKQLKYGPINLIDKTKLFHKKWDNYIESIRKIINQLPKRRIFKKILFILEILEIKKILKEKRSR